VCLVFSKLDLQQVEGEEVLVMEEARDSDCAVWQGGASTTSQTANKEKLGSTLANLESNGFRDVHLGETSCDREVVNVA
jgi:hypothetical protein